MSQPNPITIDGVQGESRFFHETGTELVEYRDGNCLVMLGRPGIFKRADLNVRLADEKSVWMKDGAEISDEAAQALLSHPGYDPRLWWKRVVIGGFAELQACYLRACARHGFEPQSEASNLAFFEQTRGYGVLWAGTKLNKERER